jgi:ferredoxin
MRVTVDAIMCEANAVCARLAPEIFSVDEVDGEDLMTIAADGDVPPELADRVREAVRSCPKMALLLEE